MLTGLPFLHLLNVIVNGLSKIRLKKDTITLARNHNWVSVSAITVNILKFLISCCLLIEEYLSYIHIIAMFYSCNANAFINNHILSSYYCFFETFLLKQFDYFKVNSLDNYIDIPGTHLISLYRCFFLIGARLLDNIAKHLFYSRLRWVFKIIFHWNATGKRRVSIFCNNSAV